MASPVSSDEDSASIDALRKIQCDAWEQGQRLLVEQLIKQHRSRQRLSEDQLLELILAERGLRQASGCELQSSEYVQRFPSLKEKLLRLFSLDAELQNESEPTSSTVVPGGSSETVTIEEIATITPMDGKAHAAALNDFSPGTSIGKYRLVSRLGQGGMGAVYCASHTLIDHRVALKVMLPHLVQRSELQQRFLKEAQLCVSLQHPNLVRTFDVDSASGCLYLTMELLSGNNLAETIAGGGAIPPDLVYTIIRQAAAGLAHAHAKGIVHRDIKPHNIMLTPDGDVKILDLGLAKLRDEFNDWQGAFSVDDSQSAKIVAGHLEPVEESLSPDERLTMTGSVMGTVAYMAPEQARNPRAADARSDLYSLGCTAYFLLTAQSPHGDMSLADVLKAKLSQDDWPRLAMDDVPSNWRPVLKRMLAWKANDRFSDMEELIVELDRVFGDGSVWLPAPDDLETLRSQLLKYDILQEKDWDQAYSRMVEKWDRTRMVSTSMMSIGEVRISAFELLFDLAKPTRPELNDATLTQFQVQQILAGHIAALRLPQHVILECLNNGWKGEVFKCRRVSTGRLEVVRTLALEKLLGLGRTLAERRAQFPTVIEKLRSLEHPLVGKVCESWLHEDIAIVAVEHINGIILGTEIRNRGCCDKISDGQRVLSTAIDMATAVAAMHRSGTLHLDLSTERFLRNANQRMCLLDPGIAGLLLPEHWQDIPGAAGMPPIIAPEMRGDLSAASPAADVYALGHVLKFMRTGEFPFKSMRLSDLPSRVTRKRIQEPSGVGAWSRSGELLGTAMRLETPISWDVALDALVDRMTHEDVSQRIATMDQVVAELTAILGSIAPGTKDLSQSDGQESVSPDSGKQSLVSRIRGFFKRA